MTDSKEETGTQEQQATNQPAPKPQPQTAPTLEIATNSENSPLTVRKDE